MHPGQVIEFGAEKCRELAKRLIGQPELAKRPISSVRAFLSRHVQLQPDTCA